MSLKEKESCDDMPNKCPMNGPYSFYSTHSQLLLYYISFKNDTGGVGTYLLTFYILVVVANLNNKVINVP